MSNRDIPYHLVNDRPPTVTGTAQHYEELLQRLINRLPWQRVRTATHWLRQPSARWLRLPVGVLLIFGGLLSFLPILGLWMLPLGLVLLAEDMPPLRRWRDRCLDWVARKRPHWLTPVQK